MQRSALAVDVHPVEREIDDDPVGDLKHVAIRYEEVSGSAASAADELPRTIAVVRRVLIQFRRIATRYLPLEFRRAEPVRQYDRAEALDHGIKDLCRQLAQSEDALRRLRHVAQPGDALRLPALNKLPIGQVASAAFVEGGREIVGTLQVRPAAVNLSIRPPVG